ncbi:MAG: hypothetical protein AB7K09_22285 [Planctomycetota bacterium]
MMSLTMHSRSSLPRFGRLAGRLAGVGLLALAAVLAIALPAVAQDSPDNGASIYIEPANVASNQQDVTINIYAFDGELFSRPSGRLPEVQFGPGVTLKRTSYVSPKQIRCTIDTAADGFGAPDVRVLTWSLNGETVTQLSTSSLGLLGPAAISPLTVSASQNALVVPDKVGLQTAGDLTVTGPLVGTVTVTAPAGVRFSSIAASKPKAASQSVGFTVTEVQLADDEVSFTFDVINPTFKPLTVKLSNLMLNLVDFTASGGELGEVLFGVSIGTSNPIGTSSAHTPGRTIQNPTQEDLDNSGSGDVPGGNSGGFGGGGVPAPDPNAGTGDGTTDPTSAGSGSTPGTANGNSSSPSSSQSSPGGQSGQSQAAQNRARNNAARNNRNNNQNRNNFNRSRGGQQQQNFSGGFRSSGSPASADAGAPADSPNPAPAAGGGGKVVLGGGSSLATDGVRPRDPDVERPRNPTIKADPEIEFIVRSFTLCDEVYRPLTGVGFRPALDGSGAYLATVHVQVVLAQDATPGRKTRLEVDVVVPGAQPVRAILEETRPDSGVFRSAAGGVTVRIDPSSDRD